MKLIIRDYLASLREREELDAILPDLLSELGYSVYSRPRRGTTQYGVDVAAVGTDEDGERKVFLFSIKRGDLTRQEWDAPLQGLRSSLNEIRDAYIPTRIPQRYRALRIVICVCFGGDVQEQAQPLLRGYVQENTTDRVSYDEWNGDKLAGMIEQGILREKVLPSELRAKFRKAVAMVDEPDVSYQHFAALLQDIAKQGSNNSKARVRSARQMFVCLWVLFVWARDAGNVESAYRSSEASLLHMWNLLRALVDARRMTDLRAIERVLRQTVHLHMLIACELLEKKILPVVSKRHAVSMAIGSRSATDINIKLFDILGRIALYGLWLRWMAPQVQVDQERIGSASRAIADAVVQLIENNPALATPLLDEQVIDIVLVVQLCLQTGSHYRDVANWLHNIAVNIEFAHRVAGRYPCVISDYAELIDHPRDSSAEYLQEVTSGSSLIPFLAAWVGKFGDSEAFSKLAELKSTILAHCTMQSWLPGSDTDDQIYIGGRDHGAALTDLPLGDDGQPLIAALKLACDEDKSFDTLSAIRLGFWPLLLVACRHHRIPIPPQFWIGPLVDEGSAAA